MRWMLALIMLAALCGTAADLVTLNEENYAEYAPTGKEVDAIFGDYVLRNDRIVVAIADPTLQVGRSGSRVWRTRLEGNIIDLSRRDGQDLLGAFNGALRHPAKRWLPPAGIVHEPHNQDKFIDSASAWKQPGREPQSAASVTLTLPWEPPLKEVRYTLADGWDHVQVEVVYLGSPKADTKPRPNALLYNGPSNPERHDLTYYGAEDRWAWFYDPTFRGAYGVVAAEGALRQYIDGTRKTWIFQELLQPDKSPVVVPKGGEYTAVWYVIPAQDLTQLRLIVDGLLQRAAANRPLTVTVRDPAGPVADAFTIVRSGRDVVAASYSDAQGRVTAALPPGDYTLEVQSASRRSQGTVVAIGEQGGSSEVVLPAPAMLFATITGDDGKPLPCKVILRGQGDTPDPDLGPVFGYPAVANVIYTVTGEIAQGLPPGTYELIAMRGAEYHAHTQIITVAPGQPARVAITLERAVDTRGWISADFGGVTTVSREDSLSPVEGRLHNLLAEGIEFAPATESDTITDWSDELAGIGGQSWLATVPGIHLRQRVRKTFTAQNVFPVRPVPGAQDGGAPQRPQHVFQVFWVGGWYGQLTEGAGDPSWYGTYERLIQTTPPGIWPNDGRSDGMYNLFYPKLNNREDPHRNGRLGEMHYVDAWEVQPLDVFADLPVWDAADPLAEKDLEAWWADLEQRRAENWPNVRDRQRQWPRVMRLGYRLSAVVNSNSRDNLHGNSAWRNWLRSPTDDPAQIKTADVVHAVRYGHVVMSSGPFLTVEGSADGKTAGPGDDLKTRDGTVSLHLKVQCPNWIQADRILLIANGMRLTDYDWTRDEKTDDFAAGVVQFERRVELKLPVDTQLMVLVIGSGPDYRQAAGETQTHYAMSNPIWVDVAGDGFKPHSPIDDTVYTFFDPMTVASAKMDAEPAKVLLYLKNLGQEEATDSFRIMVEPEDAAVVVGDADVSYTLAPGEQKVVEFQLRVTPTYDRPAFTVYIPRSSVGEGRRAAGRVIRLDQRVRPWTTMSEAQRRSVWWLPEHVKDRPAGWGASKMKRLDPAWTLPTP